MTGLAAPIFPPYCSHFVRLASLGCPPWPCMSSWCSFANFGLVCFCSSHYIWFQDVYCDGSGSHEQGNFPSHQVDKVDASPQRRGVGRKEVSKQTKRTNQVPQKTRVAGIVPEKSALNPLLTLMSNQYWNCPQHSWHRDSISWPPEQKLGTLCSWTNSLFSYSFFHLCTNDRF